MMNKLQINFVAFAIEHNWYTYGDICVYICPTVYENYYLCVVYSMALVEVVVLLLRSLGKV